MDCNECDPSDPCPTNRCLVDEAWCNNTKMELEEEEAFEKLYGSLD